MNITLTTLGGIFTKASSQTLNKYLEPLNRLMNEYGINTPLRQAHFLAQLAHESGELRYTEENLKYSTTRLMQVFPKYFSSQARAQFAAYNPERIANIVYANRMGNGGETSGDGYIFRGRGLIQLTGRSNYEAFLSHLQSVSKSKLDHQTYEVVINNGDAKEHIHDKAVALAPMISAPELAVRSACWFWQQHGLNHVADCGDSDAVVQKITKVINGGLNGVSSRRVYFVRAIAVLNSR